jgi:hypothetical protein
MNIATATYSLNQNNATLAPKEKEKVRKICGVFAYLTCDLSNILFEAAIELAKRSIKRFFNQLLSPQVSV